MLLWMLAGACCGFAVGYITHALLARAADADE